MTINELQARLDELISTGKATGESEILIETFDTEYSVWLQKDIDIIDNTIDMRTKKSTLAIFA